MLETQGIEMVEVSVNDRKHADVTVMYQKRVAKVLKRQIAILVKKQNMRL